MTQYGTAEAPDPIKAEPEPGAQPNPILATHRRGEATASHPAAKPVCGLEFGSFLLPAGTSEVLSGLVSDANARRNKFVGVGRR